MLGIAFFAAIPAYPESSPLLKILESELDRNFRILKEKADPAPYYLSYAVTDLETHVVSSQFGALQGESGGKSRTLDVTLRAGSPKLDNYHMARGSRAQFTSGARLVQDDTEDAIRRRVWLETDATYRRAAQRLIELKTNTQIRVAEQDDSADFSPADPVKSESQPGEVKFNKDEWIALTKKWSAEFKKYPEILSSGVSVMVTRETKYLVNSEGSRLQHGRRFARIIISAQAKHSDGMDLGTSEMIDSEDPSGLPKDDTVMAAVKKVAEQIRALMKAPEVEPYVGPAILSGKASGVFFHEIFGHRIEGHRQKDESEGQTFTKSVGTKVLPEFLSVVFDPQRKSYDGIDLNGWYTFDDEGVKGEKTTVIDNGVLKTFLLSRSPIKGFPKSNGHGRRQSGLEVVSRQSNLIVESAKQVSDAELRKLLIEEAKKQGKPYGLFFEQVTGGFTTTARSQLQAFTVLPIVVYRIYADGRPDELVRGVNIVGTPLASFAKIAATSTKADIFNGYCGAESGSVPVSAVSPALLVTEIEIQQKDRGQDRPPLLDAPSWLSGGAQ